MYNDLSFSQLFTQPFIQTQIKDNIKALRHWPLCGVSPGTGEFPAQMASNTENVSIWWRHHVKCFISMKQKNIINQWVSARKTTPLLTHWCYIFLALAHRNSAITFRTWVWLIEVLHFGSFSVSLIWIHANNCRCCMFVFVFKTEIQWNVLKYSVHTILWD